MSTTIFTVFTPTYNRAHTLHRVYESLLNQSFKEFEWIVVDDGSTDNTCDLIECWSQESWFPIRYFYQKNQHKKVAFNRAAQEAYGDLFLGLDSDDRCVPEALEKLWKYWQSIPVHHREDFSGVSVLCKDELGQIVGDRFPKDILDSDSIEILFRYKVHGDKWGFQRTSILRTYPFPGDVDGLVPESVVWFRISRKFKTRYVNDPLLINYRETDSITRSLNQVTRRADGRALFAREILQHDWRWARYDPVAIFKEAIAYTYFHKFLRHRYTVRRWPLQGFVPKLLVSLTYPIAQLCYWRDVKQGVL